MFISCHKILTDPSSCDLLLYVAVSHLRAGKKVLKSHVNYRVVKQQKLGYWGIPMWFLTIEVPGGKPDIRRLVEVFPPKLMVNDYSWGYDFYLK